MKRSVVRMGCGLDISKADFHACMGELDHVGKFRIISQRKFDNSHSGVKECISWIANHLSKIDECIPFQIVMEPTGVYHEAVLFGLSEAGYSVALELCKRVKFYLRSIGHFSKTDKKDATGICRLACERNLRLWKPFSANIYKLRSLLRQRKAFIINKAALLTQRHALSQSMNALPTLVDSINRMISYYESEIANLETLIKEQYESDQVLHERLEPIVRSIYGLGIMTALTLVAETNGFSLINSRKQLASYAGYDVVENSSGQFTGRTRISKAGNARIRRELYMAALTIINSKSGHLYELYARIRERNPKVYKIGNVAVQRKLLLLVYTLFKNGESLDPERYKKTSTEIRVAPVVEPELHEIVHP